jgi:hypothetical protein
MGKIFCEGGVGLKEGIERTEGDDDTIIRLVLLTLSGHATHTWILASRSLVRVFKPPSQEPFLTVPNCLRHQKVMALWDGFN